ncbi:hypothetical protein HDU67_000954 [Dinochytrium kinnereticum]|nr:hypothetical protein HDU67_000954 [Dinochytrium kinnereticum]
MKNLTNYTNLKTPNDEILKHIKYRRTDGFFYRFHYTNLRYKCSYGHFQLRNLVWATSTNDAYYNYRSTIVHWSPQIRRPAVAMQIGPGIKVTTMAAANKSLFVGGLSGEYYYRRLEPDSPVHTGKITMDQNGITNHAEINESRNGDVTTRIYDLRNHSKALAVLPGTFGAIRSLRFTDDGRYLAAAEPADFVHVYDFKDPEYRSQVIDFFGDISGISFSPKNGDSLFIGNSDDRYGSVFEFRRDRDLGVRPMADMFF